MASTPDRRSEDQFVDDGRVTSETIWAATGALFASLVSGLVIAFLNTDIGRDSAANLEGAGRALIAAPVILMCLIVFGTCVAALVLPEQRRRLLVVAGVTAGLIVAWAVMAAVVLAGLAYAVDRIES